MNHSNNLFLKLSRPVIELFIITERDVTVDVEMVISRQQALVQ